MQTIKNNLFLLVLMAVAAMANGQNFSAKATLKPVDKDGFYTIAISPMLSSYLATDFRDLRIADEQKNFVPYIIRSPQPAFSAYSYIKLPIIKNELADSGRSILVIQNDATKKIAAIALILRNAAVTRTAAISGSDDTSRWFTIDEDIYFQKQFVTDTDKYIQTIQFPASTYKYLKLVIDNGKNNPLHIMEAGMYTHAAAPEPPLVINPAALLRQTDSTNNTTYLVAKQPAVFHFSKIRLLVKGPQYYKRSIDIITSANTASYELVSGKTSVFNVEPCNDSSFLIKIYNGDNPPLQFDSVVTEQESRQLVTYLEASKNYHLLMQNSLADKPVYDLKQFTDSIGYDIPVLEIASIEELNNAQPINESFFSKNWIWPVIVIVLLVLGFFTLRLVREVNKREQ